MNNNYLEEKLNPLQEFIKSKGIYVAMASTIIGLFGGIPLLFWMANVTIVNTALLMILIFICGGLGLLQWRYVYRFLDMNYYQFAMYAYSGFGMCLINFLLLLNLWLPITNYSETYTIKHFGVYNQQFQVNLYEDVSQTVIDNISDWANKQFEKTPDVHFVTVTYNTGIIGFDTFGNCEFK
jgi:hypothetical protein